ncbi:MAG: FkbM family methyltransferase [Chloroflexi bacterium]|nr:FkbM family methyltransferase [Chloroflexota bacterium]
MQDGFVKRALALPFYRGLLPLLRRAGFARPSAYDWAAFYLQRNRIPVTYIADVGAYDGETAAHLLALFPNAVAYAFEPAPATFAALESRARRQSRLKPFRLALSNQVGIAVLNVNRSPGTNSFLNSLHSPEMELQLQGGAETLERVECPMTTLDEFLAAHPEFQPQLLKTDTQGFDLHVLEGARATLKNHVRAVVAEVRFAYPAYQDDTSRLDTLDAFLAAQGFRLFGIPAATAHRATHRAMEADALWVRDVS